MAKKSLFVSLHIWRFAKLHPSIRHILQTVRFCARQAQRILRRFSKPAVSYHLCGGLGLPGGHYYKAKIGDLVWQLKG